MVLMFVSVCMSVCLSPCIFCPHILREWGIGGFGDRGIGTVLDHFGKFLSISECFAPLLTFLLLFFHCFLLKLF